MVGSWHIADGLARARSGQVSGVVPPFAERTLATTECFDFGDQCTVLPTRNGDYGRSRGVGPGDSWRAMGHMPKSCSAARVLWK